jgi:hypothetical protein
MIVNGTKRPVEWVRDGAKITIGRDIPGATSFGGKRTEKEA